MTTTERAPAVPSTRPRWQHVGLWVLQIALAFAIAGGGIAKLAGDPAMIEMFRTIGAEPWLRGAVGAVEILAALGLLIPRLAAVAAAGLALLLAGAAVTNVIVLGTGPAIPLGFLVAALVIAVGRRAEARPAFRIRR